MSKTEEFYLQEEPMDEYNLSDFYKLQVEVLDVDSIPVANVQIDYKTLRNFTSSDKSEGAEIFSNLLAAASKQFANESKLDSVKKALKGLSVTDLVYSCPREFIFDRLIKNHLQRYDLQLNQVLDNKLLRQLFSNWCNVPVESLKSFKLASMQSNSINIMAQLRAILGTALHNHLERIFKLAANNTKLNNQYKIYPEYRLEWTDEIRNIQLVGKIDLVVHNLQKDKVFLYDYKFRYPATSAHSFTSSEELIADALLPEDLRMEFKNYITTHKEETIKQFTNENYRYESYILQFAIYYWLLTKVSPTIADKVGEFTLVFFDGSYIEFISLDSAAIKKLAEYVQKYITHWLTILQIFKQESKLAAVSSLHKFKECKKCKYKHLCKVIENECTINFGSDSK